MSQVQSNEITRYIPSKKHKKIVWGDRTERLSGRMRSLIIR
jgi:hypothetical protein